MIRADAAVCIWLACLLMVIPLDWLISALFAAAIHEASHIIVLLLLGGKVKTFQISPGGCVLESSGLGIWQSVCSILAGPAGSLMLLQFSATAPKIAICGMVQGLYNLLPLFPLDGGRILQFILYRFLPMKADWILLLTGRVVCSAILFVCIYASRVFRFGVFPVILILLWILRWFPRKIPCKPSEIKVE